MSTSLSPIHSWMYGKVRHQEALLTALEDTSVQNHWRTAAQLEQAGLRDVLPPFEQVIDLDDIHGSLQGMIDWTEPRLARFVSGLLAEDPARLSALETAASAYGKSIWPEVLAADAGDFSFAIGLGMGGPVFAGSSAADGAGFDEDSDANGTSVEMNAVDIYRKLYDVLLNGMPCDRVTVITEQDDDHISWCYSSDLHARYWEEAGGDPAWYEAITRALIRGLLEETEFSLAENPEEERNHYRIVRKSQS